MSQAPIVPKRREDPAPPGSGVTTTADLARVMGCGPHPRLLAWLAARAEPPPPPRRPILRAVGGKD